jgi:hypothetical protein
MKSAATRTVHCEDALLWLESQTQLSRCSVVTSMPDFSEFPALSLAEWKLWFIQAASLIMRKVPDEGVAIFYQTDLKKFGTWIDKGFLCQQAAEATGHALIWHKIVARVSPGQVAFGKPAYSHMLCFSKSFRAEIAHSTADVLPSAGELTWTRGMGTEACRVACEFIRKQTSSHTVVDPFCGHGTVLAVANELGLNSIGVEIGIKRAKKARSLISIDGKIVP